MSGLKFLVMTACVAVGVSAHAAGPGQARPDFGKREFDANCAVCHGLSAKGNGPIVEMLRQSPPDITQLSRLNGGIFPIERVYRTIEGGDVKAHGPRDMPVWGQDYRIQAADYYMDVPYDPEAYVRTRILALVEYISRLQQK